MTIRLRFLILSVLFLTSCAVEAENKGTWLNECLNDGSCYDGLVCHVGVCHRPADVQGNDGGLPGDLSLGEACRQAGQCLSGFCRDEVCCDGVCAGVCQACNLGLAPGACTAVTSAEDADTCSGQKQCNPTGLCLDKRGQPCLLPEECLSGFCRDGVCCDGACTGTCRACNLQGSIGSCRPVTDNEDADTCSQTKICDGAGVCKGILGQPCSANEECQSSLCKDGVCCDKDCTGTCRACNLALSKGVCAPVLGAEDGDTCSGARSCDPSGMCKLKLGQGCSGAGQCLSGQCRDGVCCDAPCDGACLACDRAASLGSCSAVTAGEDRDSCMGQKSCSPAGACLLKQAQSCQSGDQCLSGHCKDGRCCNEACRASCQACDLPGAPGICGAVTAGEDRDSCYGDKRCSGLGACLLKDGRGCDSATQCLSGYCRDGLCCNAACTGHCLACNLPSGKGVCTPVLGAEDADTCSDTRACDDAGLCKLKDGRACQSGADCLTGYCRDNVCCHEPCAGTCRACNLPGQAGDCLFVVNEEDGDSCSGNRACDAGGSCKLLLAQGCSSGDECLSGACQDSVCCDSDCSGTCRACNLNGHEGSCAKVVLADDDTCTGDKTCNTAGDCLLKLGEGCAQGSQCVDGYCKDGVCCNEACMGTCRACDLPGNAGTCKGVSGGDDGDTCTGNNTCSAVGACLLRNGKGCADMGQCASGHCRDGFCCDQACSGPCLQCNLNTGLCGAVSSGEDPDSCAGESSCDHEGRCKLKLAQGCASADECLSGFCRDGVCCNSDCTEICFNCNLEGHKGTCTQVAAGEEDSPQCMGDGACSAGGKCLIIDGRPCSDPPSCASGFCSDNRCCNQECTAVCMSCNQAGLEGICTPVKGAADPPACGGTNICDANGQCLLKAVAVTAGHAHTCALMADQTVRCWGKNNRGQLGSATTIAESHRPLMVAGLPPAIAVAAGYEHTCAILDDRSVRCWGKNSYGELGNNSAVDSAVPVEVSGITSAREIAGANNHSCTLLTDQTIWCWGANNFGQLGDDSTVESHVPVKVKGISKALDLAAGGVHTCAVLANKQALCWGSNVTGQIGDGFTVNRPAPAVVSGVSTAEKVTAALFHTCAVLGDSTARCWGQNTKGQLGDSTNENRPTPVPVTGLSGALDISAAYTYTCALMADQTVMCWGNNLNGQLGDSTNTARNFPAAVTGIISAVALTTGTSHACALLSDQTLRCWGRNYNGQLGDGTTIFRNAPVPVPAL